MEPHFIQELKLHIDTLRAQKHDLEQVLRDRQIEADFVAAETTHLESILEKFSARSDASPFKTLIDDLPMPVICIEEADIQRATYNCAALTLLGYGEAPSSLPEWLNDEIIVFLNSCSAEYCRELTVTMNAVGPISLQLDIKRAGCKDSAAIVIAMHDISRFKSIEKNLRLSEERYRILVDNQIDLVVMIDVEGNIQFTGPSLSRLLGIPEPELVGCPLFSLIAGSQDERMLEKLQNRSCHSQACYEEFSMQTKGGLRWFGWSVKTVVDTESSITGYICIGRDVTEQKQAEMSIQQLAYYDNLTGLPNRVLLQDRLLQALSQTKRVSGKSAVLFLDLDRFKNINDSLGHSVGDELLKQVALRLKDNIRDADTVARQGGDEFVVVLNKIEHSRQAAKVASKIIAALSQPFLINGQSLCTGASIGISVYPDDGQDVGSLLKHADMAMYLAKECGRGKFKFFSQELNDRMRERLKMESALRQAIDRDELSLDYLPQFNIRDRRLTSLEALVRWNHPELGVLKPGCFIPMAEETGLIVPLGEWVIRTACKQAAEWQTAGKPPMPVSVNLSTRQFCHPDLLELIARTLVSTGLPPTCLALEIKEQTLLGNLEESTATLQELKWQGVQLAIDDFGTGYSSLSQLRKFPINRLKIDNSFTHNLYGNRENADITEAIISVGKSLKLQVVAEGVELAEQLKFLHERGCDEMQGSYFSCPLPAKELLQCHWFSSRA